MKLAIDLGNKCGVVVFDDTGIKRAFMKKIKGGDAMVFREFIIELIQTDKIDHIYYERVMSHKGVLAAHKYGMYINILVSCATLMGVESEGIHVGTIKKALTGKGNASKMAMIYSANVILRKHGLEETKDDNVADAVGIYVASNGWRHEH